VKALMAVLCVLPLAACSGLYGNDEFARYVQRSDKITLSAGDAEHVNATTHTIDPWPPGVGDRRIPANGERMVRAIERYRRGPLLPASQNPVAGGVVVAPAAGVTTDVPLSGAAPVESGQAPPALGSQ
jgi:hypothetical protein